MGARRLVYLDNHATTQPDPRVVESMLPYLRDQFGNAASSQHEYGWRAAAAVDVARENIARLIGASSNEIVFTSGATESINLALKGIAEAYYRRTGRYGHVVITAAEHKATLDSCRHLERLGTRVTLLPVDRVGRVSASQVEESIASDTFLVSIMLANNEIGTITPLEPLAEVCRSRGILFHTDATQAIGKIPVSVGDTPVDFISFSAHKMYGPKGIGALYVRRAVGRDRVIAQIDGGGHEGGLRSGTLNVPAIVGFGRAAEIAREEMAADARHTAVLRAKLLEGLRTDIDDIVENGDVQHRLPNNASVTFPGAPADRVLMKMKDIAVSSGSACSSASPEPSHVLRAIGLADTEAQSTLRFGLGRFTTEEEIDHAIDSIVRAIKTVRATSPVSVMST